MSAYWWVIQVTILVGVVLQTRPLPKAHPCLVAGLRNARRSRAYETLVVLLHYPASSLAEGQGIEPSSLAGATVFKTAARPFRLDLPIWSSRDDSNILPSVSETDALSS